MNKKQYEVLKQRVDLLSGFMMFEDDADSLENIIESAILYYIDRHPNYSLERVVHTLALRVSPKVEEIATKIDRAYPNRDRYKLKKIDVNKLFTDSEEQKVFENNCFSTTKLISW